MKRIFGVLAIAVISLGGLTACAQESGPSGLTIKDAKPLQEKFEGTHTIFFDGGKELHCYGDPEGPNREGRYSCDWTRLSEPADLILSKDDNPNIVFGYYSLNSEIVPCVSFEDQEIEWVSCGFGTVKR
jgi:hypothetical protein